MIFVRRLQVSFHLVCVSYKNVYKKSTFQAEHVFTEDVLEINPEAIFSPTDEKWDVSV